MKGDIDVALVLTLDGKDDLFDFLKENNQTIMPGYFYSKREDQCMYYWKGIADDDRINILYQAIQELDESEYYYIFLDNESHDITINGELEDNEFNIHLTQRIEVF